MDAKCPRKCVGDSSEQNVMKNIGMILDSRFPPDIRVEKEARSLIAAGYNVFLLALGEKSEKEKETINKINIRRVRLTRFGRNANILILYLTFRDRLWSKAIRRFVDDFDIKVLHVHDILLLRTAIQSIKDKNMPIVADLHENYPAALQLYGGRRKGMRQRFIRLLTSLNRWIAYEKRCLEQVDKIIVVIEEAKERIMEYGIPEDKIVVVSNTVDVEYFSKMETKAVNKYEDEFVISYIGGLSSHRGIESLIKAMKYLKGNLRGEIKLLLVGRGSQDYEDKLKQLAIDCGVEDVVEFVGWLSFEKISGYIKVSDVCLVPHNKSPHTDATIPHKLFQYMSMGKPVIVSNCMPLKRIVEETKSGLVFESENEQDLTEKVTELHKNEKLRRQLGENGRRAVLKEYNWEKTSKDLVRFYKQLME